MTLLESSFMEANALLWAQSSIKIASQSTLRRQLRLADYIFNRGAWKVLTQDDQIKHIQRLIF